MHDAGPPEGGVGVVRAFIANLNRLKPLGFKERAGAHRQQEQRPWPASPA